jgi:hypothetical protein
VDTLSEIPLRSNGSTELDEVKEQQSSQGVNRIAYGSSDNPKVTTAYINGIAESTLRLWFVFCVRVDALDV